MAVIKYDDWKHSVDDGWTTLVKEAIDLVNKFNEENPNREFPVKIVDIKEKWGILQIDLNFYYKDLQEQILKICLRSRYICEYCGTTNEVKTAKIHGWLKTLCPKCIKEEEKEYDKFINKINNK